jgi:hypothetical protein
MVAEILSKAYDISGRQVSRPGKKQHGVMPTFAMGAYLSEPLSVTCSSIEEIRQFLQQCRYVYDQEQFNRKDYWMPPEKFEQRKKGDCDDFALWTWRQLMAMGYPSRFVVGRAGRYGDSHAWVTFTEGGKTFLVESLAASLGDKLPRLSTVRYKPGVSIEWDGTKFHYYVHEKRTYDPSVGEVLPLVWEWLRFWPGKWHEIISWRIMRLRKLVMSFPRTRSKQGS